MVQIDSLVIGEINHIVASYDYVTGVSKIYTNGVLSVETTTPPNAGHRIATQGEVRLGGWQNNGWTGSMTCVQIYNKALNEEEIMDIIELGCPLRKFKYCVLMICDINASNELHSNCLKSLIFLKHSANYKLGFVKHYFPIDKNLR